MFLRHVIAAIAMLSWLILQPLSAQAQGISVLRDAETEAFLREITDPLLEAAGLTPDAVELILVGDNSINAFVALGQKIFVHSGLLLALDDVDQVKGVIAHEIGHITGGHLTRFADGARQATAITIASLVLGVAAIAAGAPDAGIGLIGGGQTAAQRSFLSFTRTQESSADQAGAKFLEAEGISGLGLIEVFYKFREQELLLAASQDPYVRTHPLSTQRIDRLQEVVETSPYYRKPPNPDHERRFQRIKAKLAGYIQQPRITLRQFPPHDRSLAARYARIYAYNKALEWDLALSEADSLIQEHPYDPYFQEIKGQILFENGRVRESLVPLRKAVALAPRETLILSVLGQSLVAIEERATDEEARDVLELATNLDRENPFAWFQLAIIYQRLGDEAHAALATAERFFLYRAYGPANFHAKIALKGLEESAPDRIRAQDIVALTEPFLRERRR